MSAIELSGRFLHGVASGEPTHGSVLLWTRITPPEVSATVVVRWEIARASTGDVVAAGDDIALPDDDHTLRVDVDDLDPGESYTYRFATANDGASGRTRTLPSAATSLRIGVVCCARWGWNDFGAYDRLADDAPDLVLHLGDYIYEVAELPPQGSTPEPPHELQTLSDYRTRLAQHRGHPALLRLHAAAPMLALWDDHEVGDNAPTDDDERARTRRAHGLRAWSEWMPVRVDDSDAPLDRTLTIDGLLDLSIVDARYSGRTPTDTDGPATPGEDAPLLSEAQWAALERRIGRSRSPWHLIANQVQVAPTRLGYVPSLRPPFVRPLVNPDQWDGFPRERERLYDALGRSGSRPVILSGDLHSAWFRELRHHRRVVGHELTCPAVAGASYAYAFRRRTHLPARVLDTIIRVLNRGIDLMELDRHGHLLLDVTSDRIEATFVLDAPHERRTVTIERR